jgi:membrane-associated phospholipid phosphatase
MMFRCVSWTVAITALCLFAIFFVDDFVARLFAFSALHQEQKRFAIGALTLLMPLAIVAVIFAISCFLGSGLSRAKVATILASVSSLCGFAINGAILKPIFGRADVDEFLWTARHGFFPFHGDWRASFPSGHMVIVTSVATVFWYYYPRWRLIYLCVWASVALVLVVGGWHFVSDIIAGALWGFGVSLFSMKFWARFGPEPSVSFEGGP